MLFSPDGKLKISPALKLFLKFAKETLSQSSDTSTCCSSNNSSSKFSLTQAFDITSGEKIQIIESLTKPTSSHNVVTHGIKSKQGGGSYGTLSSSSSLSGGSSSSTTTSGSSKEKHSKSLH
jgi:hypothetical protein